MKSKKILAALIAALMLILNTTSALPVLAASRSAVRYATPAGYDDHDYQTMVAFMEMTDPQGVKNGTTISWLCGNEYDPTNPATWGRIDIENEYFNVFRGVKWTNDPVKRLKGIWVEVDGELDKSLYGTLDVSDCTALEMLSFKGADHIGSINVTGCSSLKYYTALQAVSVGDLDFSGCTSLLQISCGYDIIVRFDISDCPLLEQIQCTGSQLSEIDLSNCPNMTFLNLANNNLNDVDVSNCPNIELMFCNDNNLRELSVAGLSKLWELRCNDNLLSSLDVTGCDELRNLYCQNNCLTELDFTGAPLIYFKNIHTEGSGFVGYKCGDCEGWDKAIAEPKPGAEFLGWYDEEGGMISAEPELLKNATDKTAVTARFTEVAAIPGDVNDDGIVNANDALRVLRVSLGLETGLGLEADVTGDGVLNANDALLILRAALGLAEI